MAASSDIDRSEWLYQKDGMVYGPVSGHELLRRVQAGELSSQTLASTEGGPFRPLGETPALLGEVAKAEARHRVESEALGHERRRRRRKWLFVTGGTTLVALAAAGSIWAVVWLEKSGWLGPDLGALEIEASLPTIRLQVVQEREEELHDYTEPSEARPAGRRPSTPSRGKTVAVADPDGLTTESSYDPQAIQAVIRREQHRLHPCLREEVSRDPTFRGEIPFTFVIGNDGRVARLWIDRRDLQNGPLQSCFEKNIAAWRFPSFDGERPSVSHAFRVGG